MNLRRLLLLGLALSCPACGDGHHLDGFEEDEAEAPVAGEPEAPVRGDKPRTDRADEPAPDPVGPDADPIRGGPLTLERTWGDGLQVEISGLRWAGAGEIELRAALIDPEQGIAVGGFDARHFRFQEDGVGLGTEALFEVHREQDLQVVLVLDFSLSMQEAGAVEPLRAAARTLLESLPRGARVSLVRFATGYEQVEPFTADPALLMQRLDGMSPAADRAGRFTNLWGAVEYAAGLFSGEGEGRIVVVFTDGRDNVAEADLAAARRAVVEASAGVYAVGLGDDLDHAALEQLAGAGRYSRTADPGQLGPLFLEIGRRIGELLRVRYVTPKTEGTHVLAVTIGEPGREAGFDIRFSLD